MSGEASRVQFPLQLESPAGLRAQVNANGSIRRMDVRDIMLNLFLGTELEGGPANIFLRRRGATIESLPLLGPHSAARIHADQHGLSIRGTWNGLRFSVSLVLAQSAPAWFWHVTLTNDGNATATVDLIHAQDIGISPYWAIRLNEYYVSQYIDFTPLQHAARGSVLAVRQNLAADGRHPWLVVGSLGTGVGFATDALQLHGLATRAGQTPAGLAAAALPAKRWQHEHAMAVIQDAALELAPGASAQRGFFGWFEADHAAASSAADLAFVDRALALPEAKPAPAAAAEATGDAVAATLFSARPILAAQDLTDADVERVFGTDLRAVERADGALLSFFVGAERHVVLKRKELHSLRPHGHIIRTGDHLVPDEASLTSTTWMNGVFNSMVTQGHVSINRFVSTQHSYLSLLRADGQRIFVELPDGYALLDVPSAYEMSPNGCRWIYKHPAGAIQVRSRAAIDRHELNLSIEVLSGPPCRFLLAHHVAMNGDDGVDAVPVQWTREREGITVTAVPNSDVGRRFPTGSFRLDPGRGTTLERAGGDELLFVDGRSRHQPFLVVVTGVAAAATFRITGHLIADPTGDAVATAPTDSAAELELAERFWHDMAGPVRLFAPTTSPQASAVAHLQEILPWLAHNAMIHYLAPRGLEQYSGGGWGTRDVTQGPVEMLLALGKWEPLRDLLLRVFKNQNPDGDWPQWFTFFERDRGIRAGDSHGDIIFWPLLALAEYLLASDDDAILDETVPYFDQRGDAQAERATIWAHAERALQFSARRVIPGTTLAAYGHGDWNDSLQPVDPAMSQRVCSAWTVTLNFQTLTTLARALRRVGRAAPAGGLEASAQRIRDDFQRLLIADQILTGYAYFHDDGDVDYLLHPRDREGDIKYSLLAMIHAIINGLLTPEQARTHRDCIRQRLLAPDGARLFDRPFAYRGGPSVRFQRAESSSYFGREIGLMYMHSHLRYAEAMARFGDADAVLLALSQANPIGVREVVPSAALRQVNCYASSSDAAFADRYEAIARYDTIKTGGTKLEGGWRVYSSGAGVALRLIHQCFLGLRKGRSVLIVDPVIPKSLDGLRAEIDLEGTAVTVEYRIARHGHGPTALTLNGQALPFERGENPYRTGAAEVAMDAVRAGLTKSANTLVVALG